ncbi:uncharacterized protein KD926_001708 [Aspergillus affinis]|uniref:uncharacterized protein n=1 Tax=Aspergillus affinis TaxID=1070780 RepID=UPI0022FE4126|nr:uncharacterized protein KD926_001708 [Aspergillus affinis]KAI9036571.1 hypothetical protein KD926_001708 [Aspergillus affinis]
MDPVKATLRAFCVAALGTMVEARSALPLSSTDPQANLKEDTEVTFDPLGVAAVLHNPRANNSAAMLYTQSDRGIFTWPHTMMIGGTLPAMKMLVDHLVEEMKSIHPAITMCTQVTTMLTVRSDISGSVFRELPLDSSNAWLNHVVSFKASAKPGNDFAVVCVDGIREDVSVRRQRVKDTIGPLRWWIATLTLDLISLVNGLMMATGLIMGVLVADIWAAVLFFLYWCHWLGTILISFQSMVQKDEPLINKDERPRYAIYQRKEGGTVIFKGRQDQLEVWARSTWEYRPDFWKNCLHWIWIMTGTLSAFCSVACMVNMRSYMQLAFLGVLVYASLAEILAIRISRSLQKKAKGDDIHEAYVLTKNKTRSVAIIRATLEIKRTCRLEGLNWIDLNLLPPMFVFEEMQRVLKDIGSMQIEWEDAELAWDSRIAKARERLGVFVAQVKKRDEGVSDDQKQGDLAKRIQTEIETALKTSWENTTTNVHKPDSKFRGA